MNRRDSLLPPEKTHTEDPGAHDLESDDDHFSDAQSAPADSPRSSPIPTTRVEKVSDEPSYGEVPGTEAYRLREGDALPDEITILPGNDGGKNGLGGVSVAPHGLVPTTVLEESTDDTRAKTPDGKKHHQEDPAPDLVVKADGTVEVGAGTTDEPISPQAVPNPISTRSQRRPSSGSVQEAGMPDAGDEAEAASEAVDNDNDNDSDGFGDDFDDFEEGGEGDADDDDFGDFDDGFQEPGSIEDDEAAETATSTAAPPQPPRPSQPPQPPPPPSLPFPVPDFGDLDQEEVLRVAAPYLNGLYAPDDGSSSSVHPPLPALSNSIFLTPRSASLWSQLVAPPPLQPPDWIRSRIRRLFLVSLGVPVDLDEILPASKQKKLVLPSLSVRRDSPRTSTDSRGNVNGNSGAGAGAGGVARLKQTGTNASNSSVDSQGRPTASSSRKRKGPPPVPDLDLVAAQQLCATTDEALDGMTDGELRAHLHKLQALEGTAKAVLDFWTKRTDEKIGDREAFEGVIENLVAHARKTRK